MSVERDENFCPRTRTEYNLHPLTSSQDNDEELEDGEQVGFLPDGGKVGTIDPHDLFSDAPLYNMARMFIMQTVGWQCYLFRNSMGNLKYPAGTNVTIIFPRAMKICSTHDVALFAGFSSVFTASSGWDHCV